MQDMFVGDIGDFANNGLLRWLCGTTTRREGDNREHLGLAVVSYFRNPDQNDLQSGNGGHIGYLSNWSANCEPFYRCDPELYLALRRLVFADTRKLDLMKRFCIPTADTIYYNNPIVASMGDWLELAGHRVHDANLVFLNPDIGIHTIDERPNNGGSDKHLYLSDLDIIWNREQSLVIYHGVRGRPPQAAVNELVPRIGRNTGLQVRALQFHRWGSRLYFIVMHPNQQIINRRVNDFLNPVMSPWSMDRQPRFDTPHFTEVVPVQPY